MRRLTVYSTPSRGIHGAHGGETALVQNGGGQPEVTAIGNGRGAAVDRGVDGKCVTGHIIIAKESAPEVLVLHASFAVLAA